MISEFAQSCFDHLVVVIRSDYCDTAVGLSRNLKKTGLEPSVTGHHYAEQIKDCIRRANIPGMFAPPREIDKTRGAQRGKTDCRFHCIDGPEEEEREGKYFHLAVHKDCDYLVHRNIFLK